MSFENPVEQRKNKKEIINEKMLRADKIQSELDLLLDKIPEGEAKQELQAKAQELHQIWNEVNELMAQEDEQDIKN